MSTPASHLRGCHPALCPHHAHLFRLQVFVLVADPQGQVLDCRDYLAPIITPHEALTAFDPDSTWDPAQYRLDFGGTAAQQLQQAVRVCGTCMPGGLGALPTLGPLGAGAG